MQKPIAPASDALFNAVIFSNGRAVSSPQNDAEWARLGDEAQALVDAARQLQPLAPAANPAEWRAQSEALATTAAAARDAVAAKNVEGLLDAGARIYDTCSACHAVYVKDE
jgi:3-oxoacyl-ACP reductase-like protein